MNMTAHEYELLKFWLSVGFFGCAVLFYLCLIPDPPSAPSIPYFDKIEHFSAYLFLGAWFAALSAHRYWRVFVGLVLFGGFIEFAQWLSGYRDAELGDLIADTLGAAAGIGLAHLGVMTWLYYIDQRVATRRNRAR